MFQIDDIVMYDTSGVCKIADIRSENFGEKERLYYILKPLENETTTIYCPVDNESIQIRSLLSEKEVFALIQIMPDMETEWLEEEQKRKDLYGKTIKSGDHKTLVKLIKTLYQNREERSKTGKKPRAIDEKLMREAEKMLYGEIAHVLHLKEEEVLPFIMEELQEKKGSA